MSWQVLQTRRFARVYKKLTNTSLIADTDAAVATVADNPDVGERKKGDLAQLWVHKFRSQGQLYLLGYTREDQVRLIYLEAFGPHENFYRVQNVRRTGLQAQAKLAGFGGQDDGKGELRVDFRH